MAVGNCADCTLFKRSKINCMAGSGPKNAEIMVIGEAPGAEEEAKGIPFIGQSGQYLRSILQAAGVDDKKVFFTNACRCRPENNKTPTPVQMAKCWPRLEAEIKAVNPKRIIFAGGQAMWTCLRIKQIMKLANEPMEWNGRMVLPILHPSYLLRVLNNPRGKSRYETEVTIEAIRGFLIQKPRVRGRAGAPLKIATGVASLGACLIAMKGPITFDVETTGLDWVRDEVTCLGISSGETVVAIPGKLLERNLVTVIYRKFLIGTLVGHNLKFDLHFLYNLFEKYLTPEECAAFLISLWERAKNKQIHGTMVAAHWLDSSLPKGLKTQAYLHTTRGGYDRDVKNEKGEFLDDVDFATLAQYCGMDCIVTQELYYRSKEWLPAWYYKTIMPLLVGTFLMERRGVPINAPHLKEIGVTCVRLSTAAKKAAVKLTGEKDFNPNSSPQVGAALMKVGWKPKTYTAKTSKPQVREADLEDFKHPLAAVTITYRKNVKLKSTFVDNILNRMKDGILHPSFNLIGTVTGRLSSEHPNFQNIPRTAGIREAVDPGKGWKVIDPDLSQAELRVLAYYSKDPVMIEAYKNGEDLHAITGRAIFGKDELTSEERVAGKTTNFGVVYGEGAPGLAKRLGITQKEAMRYIDGFFSRYKSVKRWFRYIWGKVGKTGWVTNMFGFRRRFKWWHTQNKFEHLSYEREAGNTPIQGTASEFTSRAFVDYLDSLIDRFGLSDLYAMPFPVALVHDSIPIVCPAKHAEQEAVIIKEKMENTGKYLDGLLEMKADVKILSRWGEKQEEGNGSEREKSKGKKEGKGAGKRGVRLESVRKPRVSGNKRSTKAQRVDRPGKKGTDPRGKRPHGKTARATT